MSILIVGGDSIEALRKRAKTGGLRNVAHWSGRKTRDLAKTIPKETTAVVVILDRVNHTLVRKVRQESARRGIPVLYERRAHQAGLQDALSMNLKALVDAIGSRSTANPDDAPLQRKRHP
jgi:hypothetical protein